MLIKCFALMRTCQAGGGWRKQNGFLSKQSCSVFTCWSELGTFRPADRLWLLNMCRVQPVRKTEFQSFPTSKWTRHLNPHFPVQGHDVISMNLLQVFWRMFICLFFIFLNNLNDWLIVFYQNVVSLLIDHC
jgi:hypothetical protein